MRKLKITEIGRLNVEEFKASDKMPLIVVLDDVRSMYNVGSVFRTADAFRVEAIYLCGITACPPHSEIHKTALGAEDTIEWLHFDSTMQAIDQLKDAGYTVLSIEQCEGSTMLQHLDLCSMGQRFAIVLGNEVKGVKQEVINASDGCIEVPQYGTKHSLNVSTTAGILIWECARQLLI